MDEKHESLYDLLRLGYFIIACLQPSPSLGQGLRLGSGQGQGGGDSSDAPLVGYHNVQRSTGEPGGLETQRTSTTGLKSKILNVFGIHS